MRPQTLTPLHQDACGCIHDGVVLCATKRKEEERERNLIKGFVLQLNKLSFLLIESK